MKTITFINWIIIFIYCIYAIIVYFDTNRGGMDAAGRGMAMGFLLVGLIYLAVIVGLNFINVKWVRILVLFLGGFPILFAGYRTITHQITQSKYEAKFKEYSKYEDPHLEAMRMAMSESDVRKMENLLSKDNSQINEIGKNNRKTILGIAVQNAFSYEKPEANAIVQLILKNGGDPNVFYPGTYGPLAQYGVYIDLPVFNALLEAGADPNALGEYSVPLFYTLTERGRDDAYEKVKLLLEYGLDPNIPLGNNQPYQLNYSPVIWAAHYAQWSICQLLINNGADVNFQPTGPDGRTFWFILDEKGKEYQDSGDIPVDYRLLLTNEIINKNKNN